jgi:uncharacterized protein (TIGR03089 family)
MPSTFTDALRRRVEGSPGDPLVTFYDDRTGERVELSYATYGNWVAKTASLVQDELGAERGQVLRVDLPTHWLAPVWLGAAWSLGLTVVADSDGATPDLVVCGPDGLATYPAAGAEVVACSLLPLGGRFRDPLPEGVVDFGEVVWSQPDSLLALDPPRPEDVAWRDQDGELDQDTLLSLSETCPSRLVTSVEPASRRGLLRFVGPLLAGTGTVWVAGSPTATRLDEIARAERAQLDTDRTEDARQD